MKKFIIYTIFILSLCILNTEVFADDEFDISKGDKIEFDFTEYTGVACEPVDFDLLQFTPKKDKDTDVIVGGTVEYISPNFAPENYIETLHCSYVTNIDDVAAGPGEFNYIFNLVRDVEETGFSLIKNKKPSFNLFLPYDGEEYLVNGLSRIISMSDNTEKPMAGNAYFHVDCPVDSTNSCFITMKDNFPEEAVDGLVANYVLRFINIYNEEDIVNVNVTGYPSRFIYADHGGYGTCNFDSSWTELSETEKKHKLEVGGTVKFPTCDNSFSDNPMLEFAGWVDIGTLGTNTIGPDVWKNDNCVRFINGLTGGSTITMTEVQDTFVACYKSVNGVVLNLNGGEFHLSGSYITRGEIVYYKTSSSFTLPQVKTIPSMYTIFSDGAFLGWEDESGNLHDPGSSVTPDGSSYTARFSYSSGSDTVFSKIVYYGENEIIAGKPGLTMETCTSENTSFVATTISNNQCVIYGDKVTYDEYINVFVTYSDSSSEVYKIRVENFDLQLGEDGIINLDGNVDFGVSVELGTEISYNGVTTCDSYSVYKADWSKTIVGIAYSNDRSYRLGVIQYRAKSNCDGVVHLALCMDPGRGGPGDGSYTYYVDESFDPNNDFGKLIRHIVKKLVEANVDKDSDETVNTYPIAAANMALRVVQYYSLEELASDATHKYAGHVAAYKQLGDSLKAKCGESLVSCSEENINAALDNWHWQSGFEPIRSGVVDFLSSYETVDDSSDMSGITGDATITDVYGDSENVHVTVEGTIKFADPSVMSAYTLEADCPGFTCEARAENISTDTGELEFTLEWFINSNNVQKISNLKAGEKPAVVLRNTSGDNTAANVFVLKAASSTLQRMVIFNTESTKIRVEVPTNACSIFRSEMNADPDDPRIPSVLRPSSDDFNPTLFQELKCCANLHAGSETYKQYCSFCYTTNFDIHCGLNTPPNPSMSETYSFKEGYVGGLSSSNKVFTCMVDVTNIASEGIKETNKKVDAVGNKHQVYKNKYCSISCREEWDFSLPAFDSFVDTHATIAGTYFVMNNYMFIGTKRSCYTTYIDYSDYVNKQQELSDAIMLDHSIHSEFTRVYSNLLANKGYENLTYYEYYVDGTFACHGSGIWTEDGCARWGTCRRCVDWNDKGVCTARESYDCCKASEPCEHVCYKWKRTPHTCRVYTVSNKNSNFREFDQGVSSYVGTGSSKITSFNYKATTTKTTNASAIYSSNSSRTLDGGSYLYSYYEKGATYPSKWDNEPTGKAYADGVCCGVSKTDNCYVGNVDHDDLIHDAAYRSYNYGVSGNVKNMIDSKANSIEADVKTLGDNASDMAACQNFFLKNDSTADYAYNKSGSEVTDRYSNVNGNDMFSGSDILDVNIAGVEVKTNFVPKASYGYEEIYFMNELSKDSQSNVIEVYEDYNDEKGAVEGSCVNTNRTDKDGNVLQLCVSGKEVKAYNPSDADAWTNAKEGKSYYGPGEVSIDTTTSGFALGAANAKQFGIPICKTLEAGNYEYDTTNNICENSTSVVYQVHYISKSLANSSYFRNKGSWYIDSVTDVKSHGDTKTLAVQNNPSIMKSSTTGLFGAKYNTFPVALDTPKNIYQYWYSFKDIGLYSNGNTGRIMGYNDVSIVTDNTRSCFYEVIEELCTCCGDPIVFYSYETSRIEDTDNYIPDFDPSKTDYDSRNSILNILNSTVSLYDPSGGDGTIGSNWSSTDKFYYEGVYYTTNKGAELYGAIVEKGEIVYDTSVSDPEYSYTLNPSLLASIKNYNGDHRYGYTSTSIEAVGDKICFDNSITNCSSSDENSGYFHFRSKFLNEQYMIDAITPKYSGRVMSTRNTASSSCVVSNASDVYDSNYSDCRWIDYVESTGTGSIRLALK